MAEKISQMDPAAPLAGTEQVEVSQDISGTLQSRRLALTDLKDWLEKKNNLSASTDPGPNDDSSAGYQVGSKWKNGQEWWICSDAAEGAAHWEPTTLSADELGTAALAEEGQFLQVANNGSDIADPAAFRGNLGLGSAATAAFEGMPFNNLIGFSGRFADLSGEPEGNFQLRLDSAPFTPTGFFGSFNGSTFSSVGQFIHNNSDFGGSAGGMAQEVLDFLTDSGRGPSRYGVEFHILEISAGDGLAAPIEGTSGDIYLMNSNGSKAIFSADNHSTYTGWVRAVGGEVGLFGAGADGICQVNGQTQLQLPYLLQPSEGFVFMRYVREISNGYDASFPRFYGTPGVSKAQIAVPGLFGGIVDPGFNTAPLLSGGEIT